MASSTVRGGEPKGRLRPDRSFMTIAAVGCDALETLAALSSGSSAMALGGEEVRVVEGWISGGTVPEGLAAVRTISVARSVDVADLRACVAKRRASEGEGGLLVVDNRGAGPYLCRPLQMGADIVIEDLEDLVGERFSNDGIPRSRVVAVARSDASRRAFATLLELETGMHADDGKRCPSDADERLARLGLATLALRSQRASDNAMALAHYASKHPLVVRVSYPGLVEDAANNAARAALEHGFGPSLVLELVDEAHLSAVDPRALLAEDGRAPAPIETVVQVRADGVVSVRCGIESPLDIVEALEGFLGEAVAQSG